MSTGKNKRSKIKRILNYMAKTYFFLQSHFSDFAYITELTKQLTLQFIYGSLKYDIIHRHRGVHGLGPVKLTKKDKKKVR